MSRVFKQQMMVSTFFLLGITITTLTACGGGSSNSISTNASSTVASSSSLSSMLVTASSSSLSSVFATASSSSLSSTASSSSSSSFNGSLEPLPNPQPLDIPTSDKVTLSQGTYSYKHYDYLLNSDFSMINVNTGSLTSTNYATWIIENSYLKVTVLPDFGGRILSIYNKKTAHEELYQDPVGSPYLIGSQIFYYDWLMIMGGIFPTFPEPEHGKTWLRPWNLKVVRNDDGIVTLAMSYQDNDEYSRHPGSMNAGITHITCTFWVSLKAGRSAVDVNVTLENATSTTPRYEYWTDTTLAPGSATNNPRATNGLEIIAPITSTNLIYGIGVTQWQDIRWFKNHKGEGIAYANPNMQGGNFWGAINHDNQEGIFRISNNLKTPGLKIWTFGYDNTLTLDPFTNPDWHRPAIELWAGTGNQFFNKSTFPANSRYNIGEIYSPSVGLNNVTNASDDVLANISSTKMDFNFLNPDQNYRVLVTRNGALIVDQMMVPDMVIGNHLSGDFVGAINVRVRDSLNRDVFNVNL